MSATTFRDHLVVFQARAQRFHRRLARVALERRDRPLCRYHLAASRQAAKLVRAVAADCERELETLAGRGELAEPIPVGDALDSDLAAFEAALEQLA